MNSLDASNGGENQPPITADVHTTLNTTTDTYAPSNASPPAEAVVSRARTKPIEPPFPAFLLSANFPSQIKAFKAAIKEGVSTRGFSPLLPLSIARCLIADSFPEMFPGPPFISLESITGHVEAQYADRQDGPGGDVARWALVNGVLALAGRFKIAPGAEAEMAPIMMGFYGNATAAVAHLRAGPPTLLSVQALLALVLFARGMPDIDTFVALARTTSDQLAALEQTRPWANPVLPLEGKEDFARVFRTANMLRDEVCEAMRLCGYPV